MLFMKITWNWNIKKGRNRLHIQQGILVVYCSLCFLQAHIFAYWTKIIPQRQQSRQTTSVLHGQQSFKQLWQLQDATSMLIRVCERGTYLDAVLLGACLYKGWSILTQWSLNKIRETTGKFYFSSTKSKSQVGVSAATELPRKQAGGVAPLQPHLLRNIATLLHKQLLV